MQKYNVSLKKIHNIETIKIYEKPVFSGFHSNAIKNNVSYTLSSRQKSNIRSRRTLNDLILLNFSQRFTFITLTFKENISDIEYSNYVFKVFIKKFKYYLRKKFNNFELKYIAVPELQKRGAIHFHLVTNVPQYVRYIDLIKMWQKSISNNKHASKKTSGGSLHIKYSNNETYNTQLIARYLTKYLTKQNERTEFLGKKTYFCSRNLKRPIIKKYYLDNSKSLETTLQQLIKNNKVRKKDIQFIDSYLNPYDNSRVIHIEQKLN